MKWCALLLLLTFSIDAHASWTDWWLNQDQQAQRALDHGDAKQAAQLFKDPRRQAYAESRAGKYADAAKRLVPFNDAQSQYNRGNALAYSGDLKNALSAYDAALKQTPMDSSLHHDAQHNRDLVAKQLQQQKKNSSKNGSQQNGQQNPSQNGKQGKQQQGENSSSSPGNSGNDKNNASNEKNNANNNNKNGGKNEHGNASSENASTGKQQGKSGQSAQGSGQSSSAASGAQAAASAQQNAQDKEQAKRDAQAALAAQQKNGQSGNSSSASSMLGMTDRAQSSANSSERPNAALDVPKPPSEQTLAEQQWLRQIPDDPAGLVRRKFLIEHWLKQRKAQHEDSN